MFKSCNIGDVAFESAVRSFYWYRSSRALQLSNSIEAIYRISNILGNSSASALSAELIAQSDNGALITSLQLYSDMFDNITQVVTEPVSDPIPQTSENSFSTVMIVIICLIIVFILISSYFIWRYRTKLKICCKIPQRNNGNNYPNGVIMQFIQDFLSSPKVEARKNRSNRDVPVTYDIGTPKILSNVVVSAAWDGMRVVASNLPYIRALFGVCDGILGLFVDYQDQDENIKQVMNWISNIKVLMTYILSYK